MASSEDLELFYQGDKIRDFELFWLTKFSNCLEEIAGEAARSEVMCESQHLIIQVSK